MFNTHPDVARSALIGPQLTPTLSLAGRQRHRTPVVCVELHPDARGREQRVLRELRELAGAHESTKGIDSFAVIDQLPVDKRHNAKIDRPALAARVTEGTLAIVTP